MARRRRRAGGGSSDKVAMPNLNSLLDVVTIILVYLIKSMASSPIDVKDPSVNLPISSSMESIEDSVVVMITGAERKEVLPNGAVSVPAIPTIVVDDDVIMQLGADFSVPEDQLEKQIIIKPLKQRLLEVRKQQGVTAELTDSEGFSGKIVFVVDKNVPFKTLSKALVSSAQAGYDGFKFAIVKKEG